MFEPSQYQLLDFGRGRKLERFGQYVLDRPAPAASGTAKAATKLWATADAVFERGEGGAGHWKWAGAPPTAWSVTHGRIVLELRATDHGHLGLFAEQAANWDWIAACLAAQSRAAKVLNLFAYTGASTLAAPAAGAEVVHVDAARNIVQRARRNARLSGLEAAPIRWIVEDVRRFVAREQKRRNQYDAVLLDPPSYGHGPKGEAWKIDSDLGELVRACGHLTERRRLFILLTCHSSGWDSQTLEKLLRSAVDRQGRVSARKLSLHALDGRQLVAGESVFWLP